MAKKIIVYHSKYGCETGCCGHIVEITDPYHSRFNFVHPEPGEDHLAFAKELIGDLYGAEHVKDLDWENCHIKEDED